MIKKIINIIILISYFLINVSMPYNIVYAENNNFNYEEYINNVKKQAEKFKTMKDLQSFENYLKNYVNKDLNLLKENYKEMLTDTEDSIYTNDEQANEIYNVNNEVLNFIKQNFYDINNETKEFKDFMNKYMQYVKEEANDFYKLTMLNVFVDVFGNYTLEEKYKEQYDLWLELNPIADRILNPDESDFLPPNTEDEIYFELDDQNNTQDNNNGNNQIPNYPKPIQKEYKIISGKCYEITTQGDKKTQKEVSISYCKSENTGEIKTLEPTIPTTTKNTNLNNIPSNDVYYNNQIVLGKTNGQNQDNKEKESGVTIQYTLNKNSNIQNFYDTAIRITNNTITYEQMKNILYQISVSSNGQYIEDRDKCMALIDGKLIVLYNKNMSIQEFENIFNDLPNVEVLALDTKIGTVTSISEYLEINMIKNIKINNKDYVLKNTPIVKANKTLFELSEFAKLLGANIYKEKDKVIIEKGNNKMIYYINTDKVQYNNEYLKVPVKTQEINNKVYGYVQILIDKLDYTLSLDSSNNILIINKKQS